MHSIQLMQSMQLNELSREMWRRDIKCVQRPNSSCEEEKSVNHGYHPNLIINHQYKYSIYEITY